MKNIILCVAFYSFLGVEKHYLMVKKTGGRMQSVFSPYLLKRCCFCNHGVL